MISKMVKTSILHCLPLAFITVNAGWIIAAEPEGVMGESAREKKPDMERRQAIAAYEDLRMELESAGGVYAEQMIEVKQNLGRLYQQAGNHPEAVAVLKQALQALRVNQGLHTLNQVDIIAAIIDSHMALNDREALRKNYEYLYWVYKRNYGEDDARLIPVIKKIGQWYFDLYNFSLPGTTIEPLIAADDLYDKALQLMSQLIPGDSLSGQQANIFYNIAVINYHISKDIMDHKLSYGEIREAMIPNGRGSPYVNEAAVRQFYFDQSYFKGRRSLNRVVESYQQGLPATVIQYAEALIFLGDWYTVQRRTWNGTRAYQRAYGALVEHHVEQSRIDELFGAPQPIEQLPIPGEPEYEVKTGSYYVDAIFDVPADGWPENIKIQSIQPSDEPALFKRGERAISSTRYRPRYQDGKAVATDNVNLRYVFKYKKQPGGFHF